MKLGFLYDEGFEHLSDKKKPSSNHLSTTFFTMLKTKDKSRVVKGLV